jgi:Tol biopolymer transport system component
MVMEQLSNWRSRQTAVLWLRRLVVSIHDQSLRALRLTLVFWLAVLGLPAVAAAINADQAASALPTAPRLLDGRHVVSYRISPSSRSVVYQVGSDIYSIGLFGGSPVELTVSPAEFGAAFLISPDSRRVVFLGNNPGATKSALFSVPLSGGIPTLLSAANIPQYWISPDSRFVVYAHSPDSNSGPRDIYSVPITGGTAVKLNTPLLENQRVESELLSPDSHYVVYELNPGTSSNQPHRLYRVPLTGGASVKLDEPFAAERGDTFNSFRISPDSRYVVYPRSEPATAPTSLYAAPLSGEAPYKLASPAGASVEPFTLAVTADSRRVIFNAGGRYYSTLLDGSGTAVELAPLVDFMNITQVELSLDGRYLVYAGGDGTAYRVRSIPVTGGDTVTYTGEEVNNSRFAVSPDSRRVIYLAGGTELNSRQLYSGPLDGSAEALPVGDPAVFPSLIEVDELQFTPDGKAVLYRVRQTTGGRYDLFMTATDKTESSVKLNGPVGTVMAPPNDPRSFRIAPDGRNVVFQGGADPDLFAPRQLYAVTLREIDIKVFLPLTRR